MDQCLFVDDAAARDVDEVTSRSKGLQNLRIDQMPGLASTLATDDENVAFAGQCQHALDMAIRNVDFSGPGISQCHAEWLQPCCDAPANAAQADDANGLSGHAGGECISAI